MSYRIKTMGKPPDAIVVVGVGGTGAFVADGLCRFIPAETPILLIDPDRVEQKNLIRQAFYPGDLGKFKARVVADRLAMLYGRRVGFSVNAFSTPLLQELHGALEGVNKSFGSVYPSGKYEGWDLIIGCTDNPGARDDIAHGIKFPVWWLDAGNGDNSGQVFIGNASRTELSGSFIKGENDTPGEVLRLPMPTLVEPGLLAAVPEPVQDLNCAEAVEQNLQSPVINQFMAALVLEFVRRLIAGNLTWMSAYIDLDVGSLRTVDISPGQVAKIMSMKQRELWPPKQVTNRGPGLLAMTDGGLPRVISAEQFVRGDWGEGFPAVVGTDVPEINEEEE